MGALYLGYVAISVVFVGGIGGRAYAMLANP